MLIMIMILPFLCLIESNQATLLFFLRKTLAQTPPLLGAFLLYSLHPGTFGSKQMSYAKEN